MPGTTTLKHHTTTPTEKYAPLLRVLGVRESFTVPDLARALQALHEGSSGPLPSLDLQQAIGLLRALQKVCF